MALAAPCFARGRPPPPSPDSQPARLRPHLLASLTQPRARHRRCTAGMGQVDVPGGIYANNFLFNDDGSYKGHDTCVARKACAAAAAEAPLSSAALAASLRRAHRAPPPVRAHVQTHA